MTASENQPALPPRKRRWFQYSLRTLLVATLLAAIGLGWAAAELRKIERQRLAYKRLSLHLYSDGGGSFPWFGYWLRRLVGDERNCDPSFMTFNNFASIDDNTLKDVAQFDHLEHLSLGGHIWITDAGLEHLKRLKRLRVLYLSDAPVSAKAVGRLRRALPACEILWEPPSEDKRRSRAASDELR